MVAYNDGFNVYDALIGESRYPIPSIPYYHITIYPACDSVCDTRYHIPYTLYRLVHAVLLCCVFDLRGITKFTCSTMHPSSRSCHACYMQGQYLKELHTTTYDDAFTSLPVGHPLRRSAFAVLPEEYKTNLLFREDSEAPSVKNHKQVTPLPLPP
jgi:hypothetical protein